LLFLREELAKAKEVQTKEIVKEVIIQAPKKESVKETPIPAARSSKKTSNHAQKASPAFLSEIEGIEADIKKLRSQVKIGMLHMESDDSESIFSDEDPIFYPNTRFEQRIFHPSADLAQSYQQSPADLSRTLEVLQQRVQALERNLSPYTVPYPTVSTYPYQINAGPSPVANGFQYPTPLANGLDQTTTARVINGWTVDEQINKSKMWLKQRNQQMLARK